MTTYITRESLYERYVVRFKERLFRRITKDAIPLFLKGGDIISISPWVQGTHERRVVDVIKNFAGRGYNDFFIDIGANIGLISCQVGALFKKAHLFEPNLECCKILSVNVNIALPRERATIHEVGLGSTAQTATLMIPPHNWGGAFVQSSDNTYDQSVLAGKDGYDRFDESNYIRSEIRIEPARERLGEIFAELRASGFKKGVVKLDVEGGELPILEGIAASLPDDFSLMIVFEYFDQTLDPKPILEQFRGRAAAYKLVRTPKKGMSKIRRLLEIVRNGGYRYVINDYSTADNSADVVLIVSPTKP